MQFAIFWSSISYNYITKLHTISIYKHHLKQDLIRPLRNHIEVYISKRLTQFTSRTFTSLTRNKMENRLLSPHAQRVSLLMEGVT